MIKTLDYMLAPDSFRSLWHLETSDHKMQMYQDRIGNQIVYCKTGSGFVQPADVNYFDGINIYQRDTDFGPWDSGTKAFKRFQSKSTVGGGILWAPMEFDPSQPVVPLLTADSTFAFYENCQAKSPTSNVGPVVTTIEAFMFTGSGMIPAGPALMLNYCWQNNVERDTYVLGYGWVRWELVTGGVSKQVVTHDQVVAGGTPYPLRWACPQ